MGHKRKIDREELGRLIDRGVPIRECAVYFGCSSHGSISKLAKRLGLKTKNNRPPPKVDVDECKNLYTKGYGLYRLSKRYDVAETTIRYYMVKLGVFDANRQYKPSGVPRRKVRRRDQEFKETIKKSRFLQEGGKCQECNIAIGDGENYRSATFHHIITCKNGGDGSPENCMVLHHECHNDPEIFFRLHGYRIGLWKLGVQRGT